MHDDDLAVHDELVRSLIDRERLELADLSLKKLVSSGSSNVLYRLGQDLLVRLPRQPGGSATIDKEERWLPTLAAALPIQVPEIVHVGQPGFGYPERWSIARWIDGDTPATPLPRSSSSALFAQDLADTLVSLRSAEVSAEARADPALRWYRGKPLSTIHDEIWAYLDACHDMADLPLDVDAATRFWETATSLPDLPRDAPLAWVHADLLAENLLVRDNRLVAVLDFGGLALGHPSIDLIGAWETLGVNDREAFRSRLAVSDIDWLRGRAWAFAIAIMTFPYYWNSLPDRCAQRLVMARAVLDDFTSNG